MSRSGHRRPRRWIQAWHERGFTLLELMVVAAIISILAVIAVGLYVRIEARARVAKAQADTRTLASAITLYMAHCGVLPPSGAEAPGGQCDGSGLSALTVPQKNSGSAILGPFLVGVPSPPGGWTAYTAGYVANANGTFTIMTKGDGQVVTSP